MSPGPLYGVGLGPGDPELITLKALRLLQQTPTILVPVRRVGEASFALTIAQPHLDERRQRIVRLPFADEPTAEAQDESWRGHAESVLELLEGGPAAFLTEGDPLLYSTFIQLGRQLQLLAPDLPIEVVPGVSSISAAAAVVGLPLAARSERLAVLPAAYGLDDLPSLLRDFDVVVLLKVHRSLPKLIALLRKAGLLERAVLVERCGRPEQRVVRGLVGLDGRQPDYLSLVIVRK